MNSGINPNGCSFDPSTGNLAVVSLHGGGYIAIYQNASGYPVLYSNYGFREMTYCGYDNKGNLFVDGIGSNSQGYFVLGELPKGKSKIVILKAADQLKFPGQVQWDGLHMTVADPGSSALYRFTVSGKSVSFVGTTSLVGSESIYTQSWIQSDIVIGQYGAPNKLPAKLGLWRYPAGGKPMTILKGVFHAKRGFLPGVTVSVGSARK